MSTPNKLWSLATARETDRSGWHRRDAGPYGEDYASAIEETVATNPDRLLAAIPSPFARLHGFDVAFGFLSDPKTDIVGESTFHANVSQCLDALELLFHWQTHQMGDALTIVRWEPKQELPRLTGSPRPGHAVLADALSLYLGQDKEVGADVEADSLWLVCAERGTRRSVLFVGSPLTIVAPAPHAAKLAAELALRMPGRDEYELYFSTITPLHQRPAPFQAYVRALFRAGRGRLSQRCERMFKYVNKVMQMPAVTTAIAPHDKALYAPIATASGAAITVHGLDIRSARRDDFLPARVTQSPRRILADRGPVPVPLMLVDEVTSTGRSNSAFKAPERDARPLDERILPDEKVRYPYLVASDLFQDQIIRVPYLVNTTAFILPPPLKDATTSFLPPINRLYLEYFKETLLATRLGYRPLEGGVRCELDIPLVDGSVLTLAKAYYATPRLPGVGTIVDVDATLVAFPMLRPMDPDGDKQVPAFDDLTTVLLAELEPSQTADLPWRTNLAFYAASAAGLQRLDAVSVQERTPKAQPTYTGSRIFTLAHGLPAAIELLAADAAGTTVRALLCPATRPRLVGRDTFYVAVDFGTTNTFVALGRRLGGDAAPKIEPLAFPDGEDVTLALHAPHQVGKLVSPADTLASHELVPQLLGTGRHPLPTRTAVAERHDARTTRMFQDVNIAFFLQRDGIRRHAESVTTNLKWMRSNDIDAADRVRVFLRELLHLVRARVLMQGGNPRLTQVIWFWPLSFTTYLRETLDRMWKEEARAVLGVPESAIGNMTESAAPFYYHEARGGITSDRPVLSVDIGGGSTDVVFFEDQKPHFGTSFNFAGNALWGDGYNRVRSKADHNGIVEWAEPLVSRALARINRQDQKLDVHEILQPPLAEWTGPSEEAINLCFAVDDVVRLTEQMRSEPLIKLMILLHYSAILFHCAQMMRLRALQRPEILCFSGFGSKALDVLDPTSDKRHLGEQAMRLFDVVYDHWSAIADVAVTDDPDSGDAIVTMVRGLNASRPLQVRMAAKLKEATCEGGILAADRQALQTSPAPFVYLGGADETILARDRMPSYEQLASDASIKPAIAANVRRFMAIFLGFAEQYESFGIPTQIVSAQRSLLWSQVPELLNLGFDRRLRRDVGASQRVTESLFFYPLIDKIVRIGKELKKTSPITV